jgi:putative ABC transport system permease protein
MSLWHLVTREIRHRWGNFLLAFLSVAVAVACLVGSLTALKAHGIETDRILAEKKAEHEEALAAKKAAVASAVKHKEAELAAALSKTRDDVQQTIADREKALKRTGADLENTMRKIGVKLGFNLWILPGDQQLSELNSGGALSKTMPESYVSKLSKSGIVTINHLMPLVTHRIADWQGPVSKQSILVIGTRGEVPFAHRTSKKPLEDGKKIPAHGIVLGYDVHHRQKLQKGDKVKLLGREFTVADLHAQRGNADDSTVFLNLKEAQVALGKQNLINAMLALECNCQVVDRVGDIRKDVAKILPGTQVVEKDAAKALARAEARIKAKKHAQKSLALAKANGRKMITQVETSNKNVLQQENAAGAAAIAREAKAAADDLRREQESRDALGKQRESFAAILVPLVIVGSGLWIALLTLMNVRQRSSEIGILRAIGLRSGEILTIFLTKAMLFGLLGAVVGYLAGFSLGIAWGDLPISGQSGGQLFDAGYLLLAVLLAPALAALASWIPATLAARQDPAVVLQAE